MDIRPVEREGALGAVAERDGREVGRLLARSSEDRHWGPHVWSELDDHGLADSEDPELYRDLYAVAGAAWVDAGFLAHYVVLPAREDVLDAWYRLSFAQQQVYGARPTAPEPPVAPEAFSIREAGFDDLEVALGLADLIFRFQREPPTWTGTTPPSPGMLREDWGEFLAEQKGAYFLAERDGQPLGHLGLVAHDDETIDLAIAATRSEARGTGVGVALTEHALHWAYKRGFGTCTTDWRSANLLSSRFWPQRGFVPTAYRFFRLVTP